MTQFTKIRQDTASEFTCARCGQVKVSKLRFAYTENGETRYICNGCYGFLMSKPDKATASDPQQEGAAMRDDNSNHISLCVVTAWKEGSKRLKRLADIEDGELKSPVLDSNINDNKFNNRTLLFSNTTLEVGTFGVWKWSAAPNEKDPEKDYITTSYISSIQVTEILEVPEVATVKDIIEKLQKEGISSLPVSSRVVFAIKRVDNYEGVLCTSKDIHVMDGRVCVNDNVLNLPVYVLNLQDTITLNGRTFYRRLDCGEPKATLPVKNPLAVISNIVARRFTWQTAKSSGLTKGTWKSLQELITAGGTHTILQEVADVLGCSEAKAQKYVDDFLAKAELYINAEDYDSEFITKLLDNHPALMKKCEDLAAETFRNTHQAKLDQAQESLKDIRSQIEGKNNELSAANLAISLAQQKLSALTTNIQEHEHLADRVAEHVRERIDSARADAAAFIAEMAFTAPASAPSRAKAITPGETLPAEKLKSLKDWRNAADILRGELEQAGVSQQYSLPFAAFMCAARVKAMPLLLAGPNAQDIADAFAAALSGRTAGVIDCSGQYYPEIAREIDEASDEVFAVKNALRSEWVAHIPDLLRHGKYFFVVHPFAEDLLIEPKSLFTYALPVFTELICASVPSRNFAGARKAPDFEAFTRGTAENFPDAPLRQTGMTTFTRSRLRAVLADFHVLHNHDEKCDALFVLFPYAYTAGRVSTVLLGISDERLRNELAAFAGEEDAQA